MLRGYLLEVLIIRESYCQGVLILRESYSLVGGVFQGSPKSGLRAENLAVRFVDKAQHAQRPEIGNSPLHTCAKSCYLFSGGGPHSCVGFP